MTTPNRPTPGRVPRVAPSTPRPARPAGPAKSHRLARTLKGLAGGMAVVILLAAGGLWWAFQHYNGRIDRIAIPGIDGVTKPPKPDNGGENFLLVGSDSRAGSNGIGTQGTGADFVTGQRSDTVILIHLYAKSDNVELVSFPRDSWVTIPAYKDPQSGRTTPAHLNKLNSAFAEGGPSLLIATIEQLSQLRIDHYLEIDFTGFKGMVNKLGGVDVCLTKPAVDHFSGINLSAGHHHISGDVALAFVRQRHGLARGDIDRIARQQQFIGSLVHKVLSASTLLDPFKLTGFLDVATSSLKADKGLSGGDLRNLGLRMRSFQSKGVLFTTVPIADLNAFRGGQSVVLLDPAKDAALFDALRRDVAPGAVPPAPAPTPKPGASTPPPSTVAVQVFNGSSVTGLGRKAAADLAQAGFHVVGRAKSRGTGATRTTVRYGKGQLAAARTLAGALPGAVLVADSRLTSTLEVVVGSSYTPKGTPPPPVQAPANLPPVKTAANNPCTT